MVGCDPAYDLAVLKVSKEFFFLNLNLNYYYYYYYLNFVLDSTYAFRAQF